MKPPFTAKHGRGVMTLRCATALVACMLVSLVGSSSASANGVPLAKGDVLAGVGSSQVKNFSPTGTLQDTLTDTSGAAFTTGMCFDSSTNLYVTDFGTTISKYDSGANLVASPFGGPYPGGHPESCAVDASNHIFVGGPLSPSIEELNTAGTLLATFAVESGGRTGGTDWVDLAANQCSLFYTGEGSAVKRFNVCTNTQEADFATGLPEPCFALRIRPNGEVMVACASEAIRLDSSGKVAQTYPIPGGTFLFALNLDPDGTSFWTGDLNNGQIWRVDIASGTVITEFPSAPNTQMAGLAVVGELSAIPDIDLTPETAENEVGTTHTVTATVEENEKRVGAGVEVTFTVTGANPTTGTGVTNASGEATFTYKGENEGTDSIVASFVDKSGKTDTSNTATKKWVTRTGCTTVIGSGQFRVGAEIQTVDNEVTTSGSKHVFEYAWENRSQHLRLTRLESASCVSNSTESKFTGHGTANVNNKKGYEITFTFTISGGKTNLVLVLEKEKVVVRTFTDEPLIQTKLQRERIF